MKKIKIFLFSSIFVIASFVAVGFYTFSPNVSFGTGSCDIGNPNCNNTPPSGGCPAGTEWDDTSCVPIIVAPPVRVIPPGGNLTATSCSVAKGTNTCNASLSWTTTNVTGPVSILSNYPSANTSVSSLVSGTNVTSAVPKGATTTFSLKNSGVNVISKTVTPAYGSFSYYSCVIPDFGTSCNPILSWSTSNATNVEVTTPSSIKVSSLVSGSKTDTDRPISQGSTRDYFLYNNGILLDSITISPTCNFGTFSYGYCHPASNDIVSNGNFRDQNTSCEISNNASNCSMTVTPEWQYDSPAGISHTLKISVDNTKDYTVLDNIGINLYGTAVPLEIGFGSHIIYLVDRYFGDDHVIAQKTVTTSCGALDSWNGTKCVTPGGTITVTNCSIDEAPNGICNADVSWTTTNVTGAVSILSSYPAADTSIASSPSGRTFSELRRGITTTFSVKNSGLIVATKTVTPADGSFSTTSCTIPDWGTTSAPDHNYYFNDTCKPYLSWSTNNPFSTPAITATINNVSTTIASGISGDYFQDSTHTISYGNSREYFLYHNDVKLDSVNITPICNPARDVWNGTSCVPAELIVENCTIPLNGSSCSLQWKLNSISNETGPSSWQGAITTDYPSYPKNQVLTIMPLWASNYDPVGAYSSSYGNTKFFVNYNGQIIDEVNATASCEANSAWDGVKCSSATFTVTPSCIIGLNQSTCPVTINLSTKVNSLGYKKTVNGITNSGDYVHAGTNDTVSVTIPTNLTIFKSRIGDGGDGGSSGISFFDYYLDYRYDLPGFGNLVYNASFNYNVSIGQTPFYLYHFYAAPSSYWASSQTARGSYLSGIASASATCGISNNIQLAWDGSKCVIPTGEISIKSCRIKAGNTYCNTPISWSVKTPVEGATTELRTGSQNEVLIFSTKENSGTNSYNIGYANSGSFDKGFRLYHNGRIVASKSATSSCEAGTVWNYHNQGTYCVSVQAPRIGSISATPCVIPIGGDHCQTSIKWDAYTTDETKINPRLSSSYNGADFNFYTVQYTEDGYIDNKQFSLYYGPESDGWTPDRTFDLITEGPNISYTRAQYTGQYTLPDRRIDYTDPTGQYSKLVRSINFDLGAIWDTSFSSELVNLGSIQVNAVCAPGSLWSDISNTCEARPAPVITLTPVYTPTQVAIPTNVGEVKTTTNGVTTKVMRKRTIPVLAPETEVTIEWAVEEKNSFDKDTVQCTIDGVPQPIGKMGGTFDVKPSSTSKYSVTCTD